MEVYYTAHEMSSRLIQFVAHRECLRVLANKFTLSLEILESLVLDNDEIRWIERSITKLHEFMPYQPPVIRNVDGSTTSIFDLLIFYNRHRELKKKIMSSVHRIIMS